MPASSNSILTVGDEAARGDRRGAWAEPGQYRLLERLRRDLGLLAQTYLSPGDEGDFHRARFPGLQDLHPGGRRDPGLGQGNRGTRRCRCDPRRRYGEDEDRLPRQPEQSDRHISALRRGPPPACRPAEARASGARRGLCRICPPQRLRGGVELVGNLGERRDDAHILEDARARRPAHRLDVRARAHRRRASTACAGRSTSTPPRSRPASPHSAIAPMSKEPSRTTTDGCPGSLKNSRSSA